MDIGQPNQVEVLAKELKDHGIACSFDEAQQKAEEMMKVEQKAEEPDEKIQLLEQRYRFMLNSQNQKFSEEINTLKNTLSSVSSELIELKRKVNEQKQQMEMQKQEPKEAQQKITETEEKRTGEPNPGDISIEKFFYCGEK